MLNSISTPVKWAVGIGLAVILALFLWLLVTKGWNGIGNYLFHRQANELNQKIKDQLAQAAEQKKVLEQTLIELARSKEELAKATKAREEAEKIFNDKSKTAAQKIAAYEASMSAAPIHTDAVNVTTADLCQRAKDIGSSQGVIDSLCTK